MRQRWSLYKIEIKMSFYKINLSKVDWESKDSLVFFSERHAKKDIFVSSISHLPCLKSHIWLATSGRVCQKWVALSKEVLLISAQAVNQHLHVTSKDRWGLCLPLFHVGGLAILARAHLSCSPYFSFQGKWSASSFLAFLNKNKITLSSLVPAQVYDLVKAQLSCPPFVRAIVVGGEHLNAALYQSARRLNWPLLPSYGLTECCSQVATAALDTLNKITMPKMKILSHVQIQIIHQEIAIQSKSLLSGFIALSSSPSQLVFQDPKRKGWYFTGDKGSFKEPFLQVLDTNQVKILGEKICVKDLEERLMNIILKRKKLLGRYVLLPIPSEREGFQIALISDVFNRPVLADLIQEFNKKVSPFERIRKFYFVPQLTFTDTSKLSKQALLEKMAFSSEKLT